MSNSSSACSTSHRSCRMAYRWNRLRCYTVSNTVVNRVRCSFSSLMRLTRTLAIRFGLLVRGCSWKFTSLSTERFLYSRNALFLIVFFKKSISFAGKQFLKFDAGILSFHLDLIRDESMFLHLFQKFQPGACFNETLKDLYYVWTLATSISKFVSF